MPMIVTLSREEFLASLSSLQNVTSKKTTIAILANVLIETSNQEVTITGTDLEVGLRIRLTAEVQEEGAVTLPSKKLFEIVRESGADHLHLEVVDNNWVRIKAGSSDYNLAGMDAEEFPSFPQYREENLVSLSGLLLKDMIDKTYHSVAQEGESQFNLTGVLVEREQKDEGINIFRMVSSDGHRLSLMEREVEGNLSALSLEKGVIIPRKGIQEIKKICEVNEQISIGFEEKQAVVKTETSVLVVRLMNGDFPNYRGIVDKSAHEKMVLIEKQPFLHSMKRMNLFTEDRFNAVKFDLQADKLVLSSQSMDIGNAKDELPVKYKGEPIQLGFNGRYFVDVLQVLGSNTVELFINSQESPCLIEAAEEPGFRGVIMPMKI